MAYEHVHHHPAGLHRCIVGSEVHRGLAGIPLCPDHDGAAASPRPLQDLSGARAAGGRFSLYLFALVTFIL